MPNYIRAKKAGGIYFFTVVTRNRQPILLQPPVLAALRHSLNSVRERHPFQLCAWVVLPDHMHCIWRLPHGDSNYAKRWGQIKAGASRELRGSRFIQCSENTSIKNRRESGLWQRRFWEHSLRDEKDVRQHLDYIHFNPVKHGLVASAKEWECSSFHFFVGKGAYSENWGSSGEDVVRAGE